MGRVERMVQAAAFGMMMGSERKIIRPPPVSTLVPWPAVMDVCGTHGWTPTTWKDGEGWHLDVWDKAELVVRVGSLEEAPWCFKHLAQQARQALEKSGRLDT